MTLQAETKLGPYEIQSVAGAGGMGEVYRARDTRLERTVAIKVLPSHLSSNADLKQRFEREARAISSLSTTAGDYPAWRGDGKELFYFDAADTLYSSDISDKGGQVEVGQVHELFHQDSSANGVAFDTSRDGKKFLFNVGMQDTSATLNLVVNWQTELKR